MPPVVRVNDTCIGYCEELERIVTAVFQRPDNMSNVQANSRELCGEGALATAPCSNKILFANGSSTVFRNGKGVIRNTDTGTCLHCGNSFSITSYSLNVNAGD